MSNNESTLPKPGCDLNLVSLEFLEVEPYFDITTDSVITSVFTNGVVSMNRTTSTYVKEYLSGKEYTINKQFNTTIENSLGFNSVIPSVSFEFPGFTINRFPRLNTGCNDKVDSDWPLVCGVPSLRRGSSCRRVFGRRICVPTYTPEFDKRLGEVYIDQLQIPSLNLFTLEETVMKLKYKFVPNVTMSNRISAVKTYGVTFGLGTPSINPGTRVLSFTLTKLVVGLTINLEALQFTYGGEGLNLQNISIPILVDQDLLFGGSVTGTVDQKGNIKAYYFIKQFQVSLLQLMVSTYGIASGIANSSTVQSATDAAAGAVAGSGVADDLAANLPNVGNAWNTYCAPVYNALKQTIGVDRAKMIFNKIINLMTSTKIDVAIGLLLCPQMLPTQPNILSCVFTSAVTLQPFAGLNKLPDINVPDNYIPNIPDLDINFFGGELINAVTNEINSVVSVAQSALSSKVSETQSFITNTLEGISLNLVSQIPVPIIPNPNFK